MQINEKLLKTGAIKIQRVTDTTDNNGFLRTGIQRDGYVVLGGRAVYPSQGGKNGFYMPFSEANTWTLKCMNWDMTSNVFASIQLTVDVIYAEVS